MFTGQVTAAGKVPPAKVLVIGAGVAGLAAVGTAGSLGAIVRAFDARPEVAEQVESMGADFLRIDVADTGPSATGYAQETGEDFTKAEESQFPFTHTEVGQLIEDRWKFSAESLAVVRHHHDPFPSETTQSPRLPLLVGAADRIAHVLSFGHPRGFGKFQRSCEERLGEVWQYLGIDPESSRELLAQLKRSVDTELDLYSGKKV